MRKIREILRLKWDSKLCNRQIARCCSVSHNTVREYIDRAMKAGLTWPLAPDKISIFMKSDTYPSSTVS